MYFLDWTKIQNLTKSNSGNDVKQQELSSIIDGNAKFYSYVRRQFGIFLQNKT